MNEKGACGFKGPGEVQFLIKTDNPETPDDARKAIKELTDDSLKMRRPSAVLLKISYW